MTQNYTPTEKGRYDLFKQKHTIAGGLVLAGLAWIYAPNTLWHHTVWVFCAFVTGAVFAHYLYAIYLILKLLIPDRKRRS